MKTLLTELYVKHNTAGKTYAEPKRDMDSDMFMFPRSRGLWPSR